MPSSNGGKFAESKPQEKGSLVTLGDPQMPVNFRLTDAQFKQLQKTLIYAAAVFGTLASGKQPTPSISNLEPLVKYADVILELAK